MNNFNSDFLKRQANRNELETVVLKQGSTLAQVAQSFVRMQRLDEVAREIGALDYRAVASDGIVRMVMSAVSLEDEFGLNANFAAFDENGVVTFYVDADDGKIVAGGGNVIIDAEGIFMQNSSTSWFNFEDAGGNRGTINIAADPNNDLEIVNIATAVTPGTISTFLKNTAGNVRRVTHQSRHPSIANFAQFSFERNTDMGGRVAFGSDHYIDYLVSGGTGSATVTFNALNKDIDFNVKGATNNNFFYLDTSAETISLDGAVTINSSMADRDFIVSTDTISKALVVDGGLNRVEFQNSGNGAVHIISAVDGTAVYFNETGDDIDFNIYDAGQNLIFHVDAFDASISILGDLLLEGNVQLSAGSRYLMDGTDITTGWIPVIDPWTRTGNLTFTVVGDLTAKYRKGTKVRYKDGGSFEYGVVGSSSYSSPNTTVTLLDNTDFAMAATTITDTFLSYIESPEGFPHYFNWNANPQGFSVVPSSPTYRWFAVANRIFYDYVEPNNGTSNATTFTATAVIAPIYNVTGVAGTLVDNGTLKTTAGRVTMTAGSTSIVFRSDMSTGAWTNANGKRAVASWSHEF